MSLSLTDCGCCRVNTIKKKWNPNRDDSSPKYSKKYYTLDILCVSYAFLHLQISRKCINICSLIISRKVLAENTTSETSFSGGKGILCVHLAHIHKKGKCIRRKT